MPSIFFFWNFKKDFTLFWRIVDSQCCVSFRCRAKWFSYTHQVYTPVIHTRYTHTSYTHQLCTPGIHTSSVQSLSLVWLFATPRTAARQASLSFTISRSLLKLMSIESAMPSNHLILYRPLLLPPIFSQSLYIYMQFFFSSNSFPILVTAIYWVEVPELYSRSLVAICFIYSSVCMSGPSSQLVTAPPTFPLWEP